MNDFKKRIGTAALLVGTLLATTNLPSLAWGGCYGHQSRECNGYVNRDFRAGHNFHNVNYGRFAQGKRDFRR
jgi:hypothetical protein